MCALALKPFEISAIRWPSELNHRILIYVGRTSPKWRQTQWFIFGSQWITENANRGLDIAFNALINESLITKVFHLKY